MHLGAVLGRPVSLFIVRRTKDWMGWMGWMGGRRREGGKQLYCSSKTTSFSILVNETNSLTHPFQVDEAIANLGVMDASASVSFCFHLIGEILKKEFVTNKFEIINFFGIEELPRATLAAIFKNLFMTGRERQRGYSNLTYIFS